MLDVACFKENKSNYVVMPKTRRTASASHSEVPDTEEIGRTIKRRRCAEKAKAGLVPGCTGQQN